MHVHTNKFKLFADFNQFLLLILYLNYQCLTLSQTNPVFMCLQDKAYENTVGKGENARIEQFLLFPQCFLPIWITLCHCHQI